MTHISLHMSLHVNSTTEVIAILSWYCMSLTVCIKFEQIGIYMLVYKPISP